MSRLIDADKLNKKLTEKALAQRNTPLVEIRELIHDAPTVDAVEVRHGRWEHDGSEWKYRFLCSECGYKLMDVPTNYCPNCGARMDGERKEK